MVTWIDSHQHFFTAAQYFRTYQDFGSPDYLKPLLRDYLPVDLAPLLHPLGVGQTVLVQMEGNLDHTRDLLKIAATYPWIGGVIGWLDLTDPGLEDTLAGLPAHAMLKGIRHPLELEPDLNWINSTAVHPGLEFLSRAHLPFDLLIGERHWSVILQAADRHPQMPLVIEHFGKPALDREGFNRWAAAMQKCSQRSNIFLKISGVMVLIPLEEWRDWQPSRLRPYLETVLKLFGPSRLLYGSDWPICTLAGSYAMVFKAVQECLRELSQDEICQIFYQTAARIYNLEHA